MHTRAASFFIIIILPPALRPPTVFHIHLAGPRCVLPFAAGGSYRHTSCGRKKATKRGVLCVRARLGRFAYRWSFGKQTPPQQL